MMEATQCRGLGALEHHCPMWKPAETLAGFRTLKAYGRDAGLGQKVVESN